MWARISVLVSALFVRSLSASKASLTGCGSSNTTSSLCVDTWQVVTSRVTWSMTYGGRRRTRHDHVSLVYVASAALVHTYPRRAELAFCDEWTLGLSITAAISTCFIIRRQTLQTKPSNRIMIFQTGSSATLEKRDEFIIIVFLRQFASLLRVVDMIVAFSVRKNQLK